MATVHVSFDSDEEFDFFTADEVRQAEIRDLEKAFEADDAESDIEVSDISDEESCDDNSDEHSDSEDDIALADIAGLRYRRFCGRSLRLNFREEHRDRQLKWMDQRPS